MNDGEVSLDPQPTQSTLPISPIFIADSAVAQPPKDLMPPDLASVDLDTLLMPPDVAEKPQNDFMVRFCDHLVKLEFTMSHPCLSQV